MRECGTFSSFLSMVLLLLFLSTGPLVAQNQISIAVMSNGGEKQLNSSYTLVGSVGQVSISMMMNTSHKVNSGFWNLYYEDVLVDVEDETILPVIYKLEQNYPNPFNPSTVIKFAVPERSNVQIKIYDILGSAITLLVNEELDTGWHERVFDASRLSSGVYIYRMEAGKYISTKKMMLVK